MIETNRERYLDENFDRFVEQLAEWLAIPSISSLSQHREDVVKAAHWVEKRLAEIGFAKSATLLTEGHPLVYAEWLINDRQPTLLIYGHYDVQPADPLGEWISPPFQPTIRNGNIYARGASDDKGQVMLVLAALESWSKCHGGPPINIKILLEGEEEAGGQAIASYLKDHQATLRADAILICDTQMIDKDQPSLITGLRGILYTEISVRGAKIDLHSGSYGGVAPNPLHALCLLLSRLKDEDGAIRIPELTAAMPEPEPGERELWQADPLHLDDALRAEMGITDLFGESAYPPMERIGLRPTFEVHGIRGGFTGEGAKTVIPAEALAKVSLRLPATLDPHVVFSWLKTAVAEAMPAGYPVQVTCHHVGRGISIDPNNHYIRAAAEALDAIFGRPPIYLKEGGSIPIAALFNEALAAPIVLMGFALPDDTIHAPNENFNLDQFRKGMKVVANFLGRLQR